MKKQIIIEFKDVNVFYEKSKYVINGASFDIAANDFVIIMGPNGSGKTSLVNTLLGFTKYYGTIFLNLKNIKKYSRKEIARKIAYVAQAEEMVQGITVVEYLKMARIPHYSAFENSASDLDLIEHYLAKFNFLQFKNKYIEDLSSGERRLLSIISGIVQETEIIIVDEPTNHLDPKVSLQIFEVLKQLQKEGKTIILVTRAFNEALAVGNKLLLIKDDVIQKYGDIKKILIKKNIEEIFEVNVSVSQKQIAAISPKK